MGQSELCHDLHGPRGQSVRHGRRGIDDPSCEAEVTDRPDLQVVQGIDTGEHYRLAISKDNPSLKAAVDDALQAIINDGTYGTIYSKYFPGATPPPEYQPSP